MGKRNPAYDVPLSDERRDLARDHYGLIHDLVVVPWWRRRRDLRVEILDAGHDGLVMAAQAYPERCEHAFATYALNKADWCVRAMLRAERVARVVERLADDPEARPEGAGAGDGFARLLALLTPAEAAAVALEYGQGMTHREAAAALGISHSAATLRSQHGLDRLRYELRAEKP